MSATAFKSKANPEHLEASETFCAYCNRRHGDIYTLKPRGILG